MRDRLGRKPVYSAGDLLGSSLASSNVRSNGGFLGGSSTEDDLREEDVWGGSPDAEVDGSDADDDSGGRPQQTGENVSGDGPPTFDSFNAGSRTSNRGRWKQTSGLAGLGNGVSEGWKRLNGEGVEVRSNGHAVIGAGGSPTTDPLRVSTPLRIIPQLTPGSLARHPMRRQSAPMNVPDWSKISGFKSAPLFVNDDSEDEQFEKAMVPPHELMAREYSQSVTFSVYEGVGRTLRGRDLTGVRTAVLRQTGFLDG